mmetsp:Transcript_54279/g.129362  ORF Transcript_54279/g.129362 Transcript_54279/m.129362 type:complete len:532 (+) Transcript_54279:95-1690(+)
MPLACGRIFLPFIVLCTQIASTLASELSDDKLGALILVKPSAGSTGDKKARKQLGYLAKFSVLPPHGGVEGVAWAASSEVQDGCEAQPYAGMPAGAVAVARRGQCSFVDKALKAQAAGASAIVIVSDSEHMLIMSDVNSTAGNLNIVAVGVPKSVGDDLLQEVADSSADKHPRVSVQPYALRLWNASEGIVILLATSLVAAGAFFSTADLRSGSPLAPRRDEVVEMDSSMAIGLCSLGSVMLVVLFFFMKYLIYVILAAFCFGGATCITQLSSSGLHYLCPGTRRHVLLVPQVGPATVADLLAVVPAVVLVLAWLCTRRTDIGWVFQDIIGGAFLCMFQRTLRLPDMKVASLLLSMMFFFDIFWVFLSPLIFQRSVMIEVAKGGNTGESVPLLLRIPAIGDPLANDRMLGFGDIALPGLLVSYLLRYDMMKQKSKLGGYFLPALGGYFVGLCITILALIWMRSGQPALLYLVPCTLGTTLLLARSRRELSSLWSGASQDSAQLMEVPNRQNLDGQSQTGEVCSSGRPVATP